MVPAEPLDEHLIELFSRLSHVTSIESAKSILLNKKIHGTDSLGNANFGLEDFPRRDIAAQKEICMLFRWEGKHAVIDWGKYFENYSEWVNPPQRNIAYHFKIVGDLPAAYCQTNIYGCDAALKFVEARVLFKHDPKYFFIQKLVPKILYRCIDRRYSNYDTLVRKVVELNKLSGTYVAV